MLQGFLNNWLLCSPLSKQSDNTIPVKVRICSHFHYKVDKMFRTFFKYIVESY